MHLLAYAPVCVHPSQRGVARMEGLITLVCREPEHQGAPESVSNSITTVGREWAYCPCGAANGHQWESTKGTTVEELKRVVNPSETRTQVAPGGTG